MKQKTSASEANTIVVDSWWRFPPPLPPTWGALAEAKKLYNYKRVRGWTSAESHRVKRTRKLNPGTK